MSHSRSVSKLYIPKVAIIGLGLIGCSWVKALKKAKSVGTVSGFDRNIDSMQEAMQAGLIDDYSLQITDVVADADLIIVSVPILAVAEVLDQIKSSIGERTILTDVGSVKGNISKDVSSVLGENFDRFVLGHPIAGSERSGVSAADEDLFKRHKIILTPEKRTSERALDLVTEAWKITGGMVELMSVQRHDEVLAATSHLPHLLAYSLVDTLANDHENNDIFNYAAGGFRDFTRIASSSPIMWRDIFVGNKDEVLKALDSMTSQIVNYVAKPGGKLSGEFRVPGDKSISHRSIMLGSLAEGTTEVTGFLEGEDSLATLQSFRDMGVVIEGPHRGRVTVHGVGLHGLKTPPNALYLGNSGTSMRLLSGLMAAQSFDVEMTGDVSLSKRPMDRVANPLREMGAVIESADKGRPPLKIKGGQPLKGIHYVLPMASAQVKSCLLLAGLYAEGETTVIEPAPTRDHTERMLKGFGYSVDVDGPKVTVRPGGKLIATAIDVPSDISSAAFFMVAASIAKDSDITLQHVGINPTRVGVINILRQMGANIEMLNEREVGGEPVADLRIRSAQLKGIQIPEDQVPLAIDEFPAIFIAAACAEGTTVLTGAEELRVKESDRIQAMVDGLQILGVDAVGTEDGAIIKGFGNEGSFNGGEVDSVDDHRIAMSFTIASLRANAPIVVKDCANVATSFPGFVELASGAGIQVSVESA